MCSVYNFSAGPATLPKSVLKQASDEMLNYKGSGISVMEMSHRSAEFSQIISEAKSDIRDLLSIPDNYHVLFLQGGASTQFSMIPMNLLKGGKADYIVSGSWSKKAYKEATKYGEIKLLASSEDKNFSYVPDVESLDYSTDADYIYICQNETIYGTVYHTLPKSDAPLVADVSSCFLSEPMDITKYGIMYGGAQKNIGPAGVCVVIIRDDLVYDEVNPYTPVMLKYKTQVDSDSAYNTPPVYGIYICGLVFKWLKEQGGLGAIQKINQKKASMLYDFLDSSSLFSGCARKEDRSIMNVPFVTPSADLDAKFIAEAKENGLIELKGHRSVGGMRASIYNAMPVEGVEKLISFMEDFEKKNA